MSSRRSSVRGSVDSPASFVRRSSSRSLASPPSPLPGAGGLSTPLAALARSSSFHVASPAPRAAQSVDHTPTAAARPAAGRLSWSRRKSIHNHGKLEDLRRSSSHSQLRSPSSPPSRGMRTRFSTRNQTPVRSPTTPSSFRPLSATATTPTLRRSSSSSSLHAASPPPPSPFPNGVPQPSLQRRLSLGPLLTTPAKSPAPPSHVSRQVRRRASLVLSVEDMQALDKLQPPDSTHASTRGGQHQDVVPEEQGGSRAGSPSSGSWVVPFTTGVSQQHDRRGSERKQALHRPALWNELDFERHTSTAAAPSHTTQKPSPVKLVVEPAGAVERGTDPTNGVVQASPSSARSHASTTSHAVPDAVSPAKQPAQSKRKPRRQGRKRRGLSAGGMHGLWRSSSALEKIYGPLDSGQELSDSPGTVPQRSLLPGSSRTPNRSRKQMTRTKRRGSKQIMQGNARRAPRSSSAGPSTRARRTQVGSGSQASSVAQTQQESFQRATSARPGNHSRPGPAKGRRSSRDLKRSGSTSTLWTRRRPGLPFSAPRRRRSRIGAKRPNTSLSHQSRGAPSTTATAADDSQEAPTRPQSSQPRAMSASQRKEQNAAFFLAARIAHIQQHAIHQQQHSTKAQSRRVEESPRSRYFNLSHTMHSRVAVPAAGTVDDRPIGVPDTGDDAADEWVENKHFTALLPASEEEAARLKATQGRPKTAGGVTRSMSSDTMWSLPSSASTATLASRKSLPAKHSHGTQSTPVLQGTRYNGRPASALVSAQIRPNAALVQLENARAQELQNALDERVKYRPDGVDVFPTKLAVSNRRPRPSTASVLSTSSTTATALAGSVDDSDGHADTSKAPSIPAYMRPRRQDDIALQNMQHRLAQGTQEDGTHSAGHERSDTGHSSGLHRQIKSDAMSPLEQAVMMLQVKRLGVEEDSQGKADAQAHAPAKVHASETLARHLTAEARTSVKVAEVLSFYRQNRKALVALKERVAKRAHKATTNALVVNKVRLKNYTDLVCAEREERAKKSRQRARRARKKRLALERRKAEQVRELQTRIKYKNHEMVEPIRRGLAVSESMSSLATSVTSGTTRGRPPTPIPGAGATEHRKNGPKLRKKQNIAVVTEHYRKQARLRLQKQRSTQKRRLLEHTRSWLTLLAIHTRAVRWSSHVRAGRRQRESDMRFVSAGANVTEASIFANYGYVTDDGSAPADVNSVDQRRLRVLEAVSVIEHWMWRWLKVVRAQKLLYTLRWQAAEEHATHAMVEEYNQKIEEEQLPKSLTVPKPAHRLRVGFASRMKMKAQRVRRKRVLKKRLSNDDMNAQRKVERLIAHDRSFIRRVDPHQRDEIIAKMRRLRQRRIIKENNHFEKRRTALMEEYKQELALAKAQRALGAGTELPRCPRPRRIRALPSMDVVDQLVRGALVSQLTDTLAQATGIDQLRKPGVTTPNVSFSPMMSPLATARSAVSSSFLGSSLDTSRSTVGMFSPPPTPPATANLQRLGSLHAQRRLSGVSYGSFGSAGSLNGRLGGALP